MEALQYHAELKLRFPIQEKRKAEAPELAFLIEEELTFSPTRA